MKIGTNDISKIYLGGVEVSNIYLGTSQVYDGGDTPTPPTPPAPSYDTQYLTIESTSNNNTIYWRSVYVNEFKTISASTDNGVTWTAYTSSSGQTGTTIATLNSGDTIIFKGVNAQYGSKGIFKSTSSFIVYGNVMSLVYGDNFSGQTVLSSGGTFGSLFSSCSGLTSAENLVLPATTLAYGCYSQMFYGCTSLSVAPELPATTLTDYCYSQMFAECTSLTTAPELPATTLASFCYQNMFNDCTSLTTAPELSATTLASYCYQSMFQGCTSLTTAPQLSATTLASNCYFNMFAECTSLTTAPVLPATTLAEGCYSSMFNGCTSLTTAPELPATTLAEYCYESMFAECTSLTTAPELSATTLTEGCYTEMFLGCDTLNYIKCLATDISASDCTGYWVDTVAPSGTFVKAASMNDWTTGENGIPYDWDVEDAD